MARLSKNSGKAGARKASPASWAYCLPLSIITIFLHGFRHPRCRTMLPDYSDLDSLLSVEE
jgi:hypothetical protein